jgi:hypothetical protein
MYRSQFRADQRRSRGERFNREPSPDPAGTPKEAVSKIQAMPEREAFMTQAGDISRPSKTGEFDVAVRIINGALLACTACRASTMSLFKAVSLTQNAFQEHGVSAQCHSSVLAKRH